MTNDALRSAREAMERCDWQAAYKAAAVEHAGMADDVERLVLLADAAWWSGRLDECIEARERAYACFLDAGDTENAGECAVWLYEHYCFKGRRAVASGWLQRARRALAGVTECEAYGALVLREAEEAHSRGELRRAHESAEQIIELARRIKSANLEAEALQALARVLIDEGRYSEGLAHFDEAMLFAIEGRLGPYSTGKVYCSLISACEELGDLRRAAEWSEATAEWAQRHPLAVFPGLCRVHVACALRERGAFAEAEREAARACRELTGMHTGNAAAAWVAIGEVRRRVGDLEGAEAAFRSAEQIVGSTQPGLALVRLAQGNVDAAAAIIARALDDVGWNRLARARLLSTFAQISLAAGEIPGAVAAADELESIATDYGSPGLGAAALTTRGRVQLASDDPRACGTLRQAAEQWRELDVPYEIATARMLQGLACRKAGDDDGAALAFETAQAMFDQLGAPAELAHVVPSPEPLPLPKGLTEREAQVLRLVASGSTNRDIAAKLFLSEKTVSRHLSNIFTKIAVSSRAAATAFAFENGIVKRQ